MSDLHTTIGPIEIETHRLVLRAPRWADIGRIAELGNDAGVATMTGRMPYPYRIEDAEAFVRAQGDNRRNGTELALVIEDKASAAAIGCVGLAFGLREPTADLGYWLGRPFWGLGFATEAARAMIDYGFETRRIEAVTADCRVINEPSRRVLEKSGLRYVGSGLAAAPARGGALPVDRFRLSRRDWESFKAWRPAIVRGSGLDAGLGLEPEGACG
jgi:RimJ/RimL family protein N-acetyltransferase